MSSWSESWIAEMRRAYLQGYNGDPTAQIGELFTIARGRDHRHMRGLAFAAERLVSLTLGRRWLNDGRDGPEDPNEGDVEGGISVRWTRHMTGGLPQRPGDKEHLSVVLVTGELPPEYIIRGWLPALDARREEWWQADFPYPCWLAPQDKLRPIWELATKEVAA